MLIDIDSLDGQVEDTLSQLTQREKCALMAGAKNFLLAGVERLGIPSLVVTDGPLGVRTMSAEREPDRMEGQATAFPCATAMAATWDPDLITQCAAAMGRETRALGCDILLGPGINIIRTPLGGRTFEYFSEDPHLTAECGIAYVNGLEGEGIGSSVKHFVCNNHETERHRGNSIVDERALREIYCAAFERIVKECRPWTIMAGYNRTNGDYMTENARLLRRLLRDEWGYDNIVISDWGATHSTEASVAAGLDIEMPGPGNFRRERLEWSLDNLQSTAADVDEAVRRILRVLLSSPRYRGTQYVSELCSERHQRIALRAARESICLLKNDRGVLPFAHESISTLAVIGPLADVTCYRGGGSSRVDAPFWTTILGEIETLAGADMHVRYEAGCTIKRTPAVLKGAVTQLPDKSGEGFSAEYYDNTALSGTPALHEHTPTIAKSFLNITHKGLPRRGFSARFRTRFSAPQSGVWRFTLSGCDLLRLSINGTLAAHRDSRDTAPSFPLPACAAEIELAEGEHADITVELLQNDDFRVTHLHLRYEPVLDVHDHDALMQRAVDAARTADAVIVCVGNPSGYESEGADLPDLNLVGPQDELVRRVCEANERTAVVYLGGTTMSLPWEESAPAILCGWIPGMMGGRAIARTLFGEYNPGAKLPLTWPRNRAQCPAWPLTPSSLNVVYGESIFVGYRWYDLHELEPLFPFGHGLSYTTFAYSDLQCSEMLSESGSCRVSCTVTNTGRRGGRETVQVYIENPISPFPRPVRELRAFRTVRLQPGKSETLVFTIPSRAFSYYDDSAGAFVVSKGAYGISIGSSSRDIRLRGVTDVQADMLLT
ncbi:MAG: hypothetical protein GF331_07775 [Chitinivibrionales bacterium]|nr:hypothetical protein [Chitinivibrionales bacterium]